MVLTPTSYNIIKMILPKDYSEMVIKKIQEELSK